MKDMNWPERVAYLENQLADSDRDNQRLREFIEGLPDGDEIVRLRGLLTRIHGIAAEPRPVNTEVRLENIACIASGGRDVTYAQLAETQRFPHSAETESISRAMCREDLPFLAATAQPVLHGAVKFYWIQGPLTNYGTTEKGFNGEVRVVSEADFNIAVRLLQKIMARCADLLDEDQFNELDAIVRAAVSASEDIVREQRLADADALLREARQCLRQWCNGFMPILATGRCTNGIDTFLHDNGVNVSVRCPDCVDGAYAGTDRICRTCSGLGTLKRAADIDAHLARKL